MAKDAMLLICMMRRLEQRNKNLVMMRTRGKREEEKRSLPVTTMVKGKALSEEEMMVVAVVAEVAEAGVSAAEGIGWEELATNILYKIRYTKQHILSSHTTVLHIPKIKCIKLILHKIMCTPNPLPINKMFSNPSRVRIFIIIIINTSNNNISSSNTPHSITAYLLLLLHHHHHHHHHHHRIPRKVTQFIMTIRDLKAPKSLARIETMSIVTKRT